MIWLQHEIECQVDETFWNIKARLIDGILSNTIKCNNDLTNCNNNGVADGVSSIGGASIYQGNNKRAAFTNKVNNHAPQNDSQNSGSTAITTSNNNNNRKKKDHHHLYTSASAISQQRWQGYLNYGFYSFALGRFVDDELFLTDYFSIICSPNGYYLDLEFKLKKRNISMTSTFAGGK